MRTLYFRTSVCLRCQLGVIPRPRRNRAGRCASIIATTRRAPRSTRRRPSRRSRPSWRSSITSSSSTRARRSTRPRRSCPTWPRAGAGTRATPSSPSSCAKASNGTMASHSRPRTSSALGISSPARIRDDFRKNPRAVWWHNLKEFTARGDYEVTFVLNRRSPRFCRCSPRAIRRSIPATCRARTCVPIRSAPARSSLPNSSAASW